MEHHLTKPNMPGRRRWTDRNRLLLTLELAIILPAASLMAFSIWNLRHSAHDKAIEAAIQRDFSYVLKIAEENVVEGKRYLPSPWNSVSRRRAR
jgi:hypothetical protein